MCVQCRVPTSTFEEFEAVWIYQYDLDENTSEESLQFIALLLSLKSSPWQFSGEFTFLLRILHSWVFATRSGFEFGPIACNPGTVPQLLQWQIIDKYLYTIIYILFSNHFVFVYYYHYMNFEHNSNHNNPYLYQIKFGEWCDSRSSQQ